MCRSKKRWLMVLGAFLIFIFSLEVLVAGPPLPDPRQPLDEGSWVGVTGGCGNTGGPKAVQKVYNYYLVQFAPTGGFYLIKFSAALATVQKPAKKQN